jgi:hypothetical protein
MRSCLGCLGVLFLGFALWLGWTVLRVGRAPLMAEVQPRLASYSCVGEADVILPYSLKLDQVASRVYDSLGGENYIQAIWLEPLTALALSVRYDRAHINRLYAATAQHAGYTPRPHGYDPIAQTLYRRRYCTLSYGQRQVVEFISYPLRDLVRGDPALLAATDRAKETMARDDDRLRKADDFARTRPGSAASRQ